MVTRVLFVCLGNICRSPLAEGILRRLVEEAGLAGSIAVDSAGTGGYHQQQPPDPRSCDVARKRGIRLDDQRARQVEPRDFHHFDLILAMDSENLRDLVEICPRALRHKLRLLRSYDPEASPEGDQNVPDPYFGGRTGFDDSFDMIHRCCKALLESLTPPNPPAN